MLTDTLNVKLRYEAIIKKLLENEANGIQLPVHYVIGNT